ncbi:TrkH family potassium uptake protein [Pelobacter seleniigenes]|uniref:TrkH family potassium uptake protein n=1 Tax=Pelobacter seleniigenes TaxID=407188 RepID=UPI0004A6F7B4|nr:potassium transporter TrkG [Pelobacter seleniigenes]
MSGPKYELFFAVRLRLLGHFLGLFLLVTATLTLVPFLVALVVGEYHIAFSYGVLTGVLLTTGILMQKMRYQGQMQLNEAMVLVALIFILLPVIMTAPLVAQGISFADALFETISAATTTGLSTLGAIEQYPATFRFARAWMQWYGGLGIVVFSLALIVRPGMAALRLSSLEEPDDLVGGTRAHARRVLKVYGALTAAGLILWLILGGEPFPGLLYIMSAVSTGGFAPTTGSLADLDHLRLAWVVTLGSLAGAIPLALYQQSLRKGWRALLQNLEMQTLLAAGVISSLVLGLSMLGQGMPIDFAARHAPLMAFSAQTTSGFSSMDVAALSTGGKFILILTMSLGGSIGSTAGGFKLLRLLILVGVIFHAVKRMTVSRHVVTEQRLGGERLGLPEIQDALMIILLFIITVLLSWIPFLLYGYSPLDSLFEVVSATGTVGLSSGITSSSMPDFLKGILCLDMLLGRLEFVAWLVFFYYRTWFGRKREQ